VQNSEPLRKLDESLHRVTAQLYPLQGYLPGCFLSRSFQRLLPNLFEPSFNFCVLIESRLALNSDDFSDNSHKAFETLPSAEGFQPVRRRPQDLLSTSDLDFVFEYIREEKRSTSFSRGALHRK